jgi:N-acetyl-anhydromuramyl-L-alanine amidase AmpD
MATIHVRNRLRRSEPVIGATLRLTRQGLPQPVTGTTNNNGTATVPTMGLADGAYAVSVTPLNSSAEPVGPATASVAAVDRVFRSLSIDITLTGGVISAASVPAAQAANGTVTLTAGQPLAVTLQPVWMRSPNEQARGQAITGVIVHHTGVDAVGPVIETFLNSTTSAHYVVDTDGQIVKMVHDARRASHAGVSRWNDETNVNSRTIGIEIVHLSGPFPPAQTDAVLALLERIRAAFPTIVPWNVIGHSDVATNDSGRLGRKSGDPGSRFEWVRVESLGLGMSPSPTPIPPTMYGSFFTQFSDESLREHDNDASRIFGGAVRPGIAGNLIHELQTDLHSIGYAVGVVDGDFGEKTRMAVHMFQEHFFAGGRGHKEPDGRMDRRTATLIKAVALAKVESQAIV